jgi:murein DD-endopeptidase MepM/ murein hydrolase activator NlpD
MQNSQPLSSTLSLGRQTENVYLIGNNRDRAAMLLGCTFFLSSTAVLLPSQHLPTLAAVANPESMDFVETSTIEQQFIKINTQTPPSSVGHFQSRTLLNVLGQIASKLFPGQSSIASTEALFPSSVTTSLDRKYQIGNLNLQLASLVSTSDALTETGVTTNSTEDNNNLGDQELTISLQLASEYLDNQKLFTFPSFTKELKISDSAYFLAQSNNAPKTATVNKSSLPVIKSNNSVDDDPYISKLRAEIEQLRDQYQNQTGEYRADNSLNPNKPSKLLSDNLATSTPDLSVNQNEVRNINKPKKSQDIISVAPTNPENYNSVLETPTGESINPQLPALTSPEDYLPEAFNGYNWPAQGVLSSGFGWRWGRFHKGIDIAAPIGTPIFAAAQGEVIFADWDSGGYGKLIKMQHPDGSVTLYAHNNKILVHKGQRIEQGEQIAEMGTTGYSTGPHLHFEIRPNGETAVNPIALLSKK